MNKEELISYLCEYLQKIKIAKEKSLKMVLGDYLDLEKSLKSIINNPLSIVDFNLELLKNNFDVSDEIMEKLYAYKHFASTNSFPLTKEQMRFLQIESFNYLDKVIRKNDERISLYPEISTLDDEDYQVRVVLEKLLASHKDISLDEYMDIVKILRTINSLYAKDLLKRLSDYMNMVVLNQKRREYETKRNGFGR